MLKENERLEDLQCDGLKIIQSKDLYAFTSDSVILANFVKTKQSDLCAEIGAGSGVISILVQAKNELEKIVAFELQKPMQELCQKNIGINNLQNKISLICDDVKNFENHFEKECFDVVFSNPPYFRETNFQQNDIKKIAKEDVCLKVEDLVSVANKMLKNGGAFFCVYSAERSCELIEKLQQKKLFVKQMFYTENGKGKTKLVIIKAIKGGKNGVEVLPNLITNEEDGSYLQKLHTKYIKN